MLPPQQLRSEGKAAHKSDINIIKVLPQISFPSALQNIQIT